MQLEEKTSWLQEPVTGRESTEKQNESLFTCTDCKINSGILQIFSIYSLVLEWMLNHLLVLQLLESSDCRSNWGCSSRWVDPGSSCHCLLACFTGPNAYTRPPHGSLPTEGTGIPGMLGQLNLLDHLSKGCSITSSILSNDSNLLCSLSLCSVDSKQCYYSQEQYKDKIDLPFWLSCSHKNEMNDSRQNTHTNQNSRKGNGTSLTYSWDGDTRRLGPVAMIETEGKNDLYVTSVHFSNLHFCSEWMLRDLDSRWRDSRVNSRPNDSFFSRLSYDSSLIQTSFLLFCRRL